MPSSSTTGPATRLRPVVLVVALAAAAALGWVAAGRPGADPVDRWVEQWLPAAALAGLLTGLAVGAVQSWGDRSDGEPTAGCRPASLWSAPLGSLPFTIAWACRDLGYFDLTAEEVIGTYVTAAMVGFVPSLVGVGLGSLAGLLVSPRRRPVKPTPFSQRSSPPTGDQG